MKYEKIKAPLLTYKRLNSFNGVNTNDDLSFIRENQMSGCLNFWNKDGILQTRPAINGRGKALHKIMGEYQYLKVFNKDLPDFKAQPYCSIGAVAEKDYNFFTGVSTYFLDKNGNRKELPYLSFVGPNGEKITDIENISFIYDEALTGSGIFMVIALLECIGNSAFKKLMYYELSNDFSIWTAIEKSRFYHPVILRYGRGNEYGKALLQGINLKNPQYLEEKNLINGALTAYFTTDGFSSSFVLPADSAEVSSEEIISFEYSQSKIDKVSFQIMPNKNYCDAVINKINVRVYIDRKKGIISFSNNEKVFALPKAEEENNFKVSLYRYDNDTAYSIFNNPIKDIDFDGRLFRAAGNQNSHKVYFSEKHQPFYFHENGFIAVGEKGFGITAIALQNRYLFLFKKSSIYRLRFEESRTYDIKKILENQCEPNIKPPKYTLTAVHSTIGCDCPNSISFCANRLVWYNSAGIVYCLYGTNSYTEGSIYDISPNISNLLKSSTEDKFKFCSFSNNEYYFLAVENRIYVMDASVSGFRYLSGQKTSSPGNAGLDWFIWKLPEKTSVMAFKSLGSKLYAIISYIDDKAESNVFLAEFKGEKDTVMTGNNNYSEFEIECEFSSCLISAPDTGSKLIKMDLTIDNREEIEAKLFSDSFKGKAFAVKPELKRRTRKFVLRNIPCRNIGFSFKGKGKIALENIIFCFESRGR